MVRKVVTPVAAGSAEICRPLFIPNDTRWLGAFNGVLLELTKESHWQQVDAADLTPAQAAAAAAAILETYWTETCSMFDVRINPLDNCEVQKTFDGGVTWEHAFWINNCVSSAIQDGMKRDPFTGRYYWQPSFEEPTFYEFPDGETTWPTSVIVPPPANRTELTEADKLCNASYAAALVMQAFYKETWFKVISAINDAAFSLALEMAQIAESILDIFLPFDTAISYAQALQAQSANWDEASFNAAAVETFQNILYCNASVVGEHVEFDFTAVKSEVDALTGDPWGGVSFILQFIWNEDWLNAAGSGSVGTGDCSDAPCNVWCHTLDLTQSNGGLVVQEPPAIVSGVWTNGVGWEDTYYVESGFDARGIYIKFPSLVSTVTSVELVYDWVQGSTVQANARQVTLFDEANIMAQTLNPATGNGHLLQWTGQRSVATLQFFARCWYGGATPGSATFRTITITGLGTNPFGSDNC